MKTRNKSEYTITIDSGLLKLHVEDSAGEIFDTVISPDEFPSSIKDLALLSGLGTRIKMLAHNANKKGKDGDTPTAQERLDRAIELLKSGKWTARQERKQLTLEEWLEKAGKSGMSQTDQMKLSELLQSATTATQ